MCDYSLYHVTSRPAKIADKVITTELTKSSTRGFAAVGEHGAKLVIHDCLPEVAVCLLPGTEVAFEDDVRYERAFSFFGKAARVNHKVARFRQIDLNDPHVQHDALEFPNGQILKVTQLVTGQTATVLQLPIAAQHHEHVETGFAHRSADWRVAMNRVSVRSGMASILMPNQAAVLFWQSLRSTAIELSIALMRSFRRLKARKQLAVVDAEMIEASFQKDLLTVALPKTPAAQKPEKKLEEVKSAA